MRLRQGQEVKVKVKVKVKVTLEQSTKARAALSLGKRPGAHFIGGWVGSMAGLDRCGKSRFHRDSIPKPSSP
jgi:hypothetical protein